MTTEEIAWLAGWLEGEGSFLWQKSTFSRGGRPKKEYRYPAIRVACTDLDVMQKGAMLLDSAKPLKVNRNLPGKTMWVIQIGGKRALAIMGLLLPYMGKRRSERIRELFVLSAARTGHQRGEKSYQAKLTVKAVEEIRTSPDRNRHGFKAAMARKYGVNDGTIWWVAKGRTWKEPAKVVTPNTYEQGVMDERSRERWKDHDMGQ